MEGRDPRDAWAFTQRICGVCTVVHAVASCRAVEDALGIKIPANANLIRNLVHGMQFIHDHVIHFYHLRARLGGRGKCPQGKPRGHRRDREEDLSLAQQFRDLFRRDPGTPEEVRRERTTGDLRQRLLGASRLQTPSRGEPARRGALSGGSGLAAGCGPVAHHLRR